MTRHCRKKRAHLPCAALLLAVLCLFAFGPLHAQAAKKGPKMKDCHAYVVMDAGSGEILYSQKANKKIYPASTAKLMTAIVCVEQGDVNGKIKTKYDVVNGTTYGTYSLGIASGVKFRFKDLLAMSLMASAADATDSLAVGVFGSKKACVKAMNEKCQELGLTKTSFDNPVGSDIGAGFNETYSTAAEMAEICRYAMSVPLIRKTVARSSYHVSSGQDLTFRTTNWFLRGLASYDRKTYRIIGSKSGTTNAAGHVFIATAMDKKGHEVICAYFGKASKESTFASIRKLFDYTFQQYKKGKITLTNSSYDVRYSGKLGKVYRTYASLHCYPSSKNGKYNPKKEITRKELGTMLVGVDNLSENASLSTFVRGNRTGKVTALRLALLIQDLYPSHLNEEEITAALAGVDTSGWTEEEREAFAVFLQSGLAVNDACKDPAHKINRKEALLIADALSDYQVYYAASHPDGQSLSTQGENGWRGTSVTIFNKKWMENLAAQAVVQ